MPHAFRRTPKASALVIVSFGLALVLTRVIIPLSAAISMALHFQSLVTVSEKYPLHTYESGRTVHLIFNAIPIASARVIV